mgnify:CR=1 FL=1
MMLLNGQPHIAFTRAGQDKPKQQGFYWCNFCNPVHSGEPLGADNWDGVVRHCVASEKMGGGAPALPALGREPA